MKKFQKLFALILAIVQLMCMVAGVAGAEYGMETGVKLGSLSLKDGIYYTPVDGRLEERQEEPASYIIFDQQRSRLVMKDFVFTLNDFDPIKDIPNGVYLTGFFSNYPTKVEIYSQKT